MAGWVAVIGTTEVRELRGRIPWYGTLVNHAGIVLPIDLAGDHSIWPSSRRKAVRSLNITGRLRCDGQLAAIGPVRS